MLKEKVPNNIGRTSTWATQTLLLLNRPAMCDSTCIPHMDQHQRFPLRVFGEERAGLYLRKASIWPLLGRGRQCAVASGGGITVADVCIGNSNTDR